MPRLSPRAVAALLVGLIAAPAPAAESPLACVPADAAVVVHLHGLDRCRDRVKAALRANLPVRDALMACGQLDQVYKSALVGRDLGAVPGDGRVFLVLAELPEKLDGPPPLALIVPVTGYKAFRDGALTADERATLAPAGPGVEKALLGGMPVFLVDKGDHAVLTPSEGLAKKLKARQPGLDGNLAGAAAAALLAADLSVYVDMAAINKEYGEQLIAFRQMFELAVVAEAKQKGLDEDFVVLVKAMMLAAYQFARDSRAAVLTLEVRPDGLLFHAEARVAPESKSNAFLKKEAPAAMDDLGRLPAAQRCFTAATPFAVELSRPFLKALAGDLTGATGRAALDALELEKQAGGLLDLTAMRDRSEADGLKVSLCQDPDKLVEGNLKLFRAIEPGAGLLNAVVKKKPTVEAEAARHRGFVLHRVHLTYDLEKMARLGQTDVAAVRAAMGGDEGQFWFGTDGTLYIQAHAADLEAAKRHLDGYLDGRERVGDVPGFRAARLLLPARASSLYIEESTVYTQVMLDATAAQMGKKAPKVPAPMPGRAAYSGFALTLEDGRGAVDFWFPARVLADYMQHGAPLFGGPGQE